MKNKLAFTLCEMVIVVGIMGIIAEMTIPTLVQNFQEKTTIVTLQKTYSTLSQAYTLAVQENGTPDSWGLTSSTGYDPDIGLKMMNYLKPYLKIIKDCGNSTLQGCFPNTMYKRNSGGSLTNWSNIENNPVLAKVRLADGSSLASIYLEANTNCNTNSGTTPALQTVCGHFWIDVNGQKGPSLMGTDLFNFYLTNYGIIPAGTNRSLNDCITEGWTCTAWVIYNSNMDYLHCSDLAWDGKTKCN